MLNTILLVFVVSLLVGIFLLLFNLLKEFRNFQRRVEQVISEKLKSKLEVINEMSVVEARKWDIRLQQQLFEWMESFATIIANKVGVMLGGKKTSGYREGVFDE